MSFVTETKSSILISWMVWSFFFMTVFVSRVFFSLPDVLPGIQLFYIGLSGLILTVLVRFIIWLFRSHQFSWALSGLFNLGIIMILLFSLNSIDFKGHRHHHDADNFPGTIHEEKVVEEDGVKKVLTIKGDIKVSKNRHDWLMIYLMILGIVYTVTALIELNEQKMNQLVLQDKLSNAKLNTLRAQLNPHFMFNALNTVSSLIDEDKKAAQQVLEDFSFLLRDVINKSRAEFTTLAEEIDFIRKFTLIEKKRFEEKLEFHFDIATETLQGKVPSLILQPIVENAIKHGVLKKAGKGEVWISSQLKDERLLLAVKDDGPGMNPNVDISRVGLTNTRTRLQYLYQQDAALTIENLEPGGLRVVIDLPFESL